MPHLINSVAADPVRHGFPHQLGPLAETLRRRAVPLPPEYCPFFRRQISRAKAKFDKGTHADLQQAVEQFIDVLKVIDRDAVVFAVNEHVVVEQTMEAYKPETAELGALLQAAPASSPQPFVGAARSNADTPEVI